MIRPDDFEKLASDVESYAIAGRTPFAILGLTLTTLELLRRLASTGLIGAVSGVFDDRNGELVDSLSVPVYPLSALQDRGYSMIVVAEDQLKEDVIRAALPFIKGVPRIVVAGYKHFEYRDAIFDQECEQLAVPSLANGYPEVLVHIYQCLVNCSRLGLSGVVAEFGMFKGGTTMLLSRFIERLGQSWPVVGFDTFGGFPAPASPLDMYDNPECVYEDISAVRRLLADRNVEIVVGNIVETCTRLSEEDVLLTFIDTDNFTSAKAIIDVVAERTVVGGAIIFDHFTGNERFRYTLGERMAAAPLLDDHRFFHLHGTGVFYRQCG